MPALNLIVIRSQDIDRLAAFYSALGLVFTKHAHSTGPEHYAAEQPGMVFELYPATEKEPQTTSIRLGFRVEADLESVVLPALKEKGGRVFSCWGANGIVFDPDGHKVHLTQKSTAT